MVKEHPYSKITRRPQVSLLLFLDLHTNTSLDTILLNNRCSSLIKKAVADPEKIGGVDDKIYKNKLCIISKFRLFMINVLDLAQTCWAYFLIRRIARICNRGEAITGCGGEAPAAVVWGQSS